jgi:hypothetical protein
MNRVICLALALGVVSVAQAAPPIGQIVDPEMSRWYESLRQPQTNARCCSIADCRPYDSRIADGHYEILLYGRWFAVPSEVVLHRENKAGAAIACLMTEWNLDYGPVLPDFSRWITCFLPGPEA